MSTLKSSPTLLMILLLLSSEYAEAFYFKKVHVYVTNKLQGGKTLTVSCKSKDDDLGVHKLAHNQTFEWSFRNNIWDSTLFWCHMGWYKKGNKLVYSKYNIYKATRDQIRCFKRCYWSILDAGLYSFSDPKESWEKLYNWP